MQKERKTSIQTDSRNIDYAIQIEGSRYTINNRIIKIKQVKTVHKNH